MVECPHCRTLLEVPPEQRGAIIVCGHCGRRLEVPAASEQIQSPDRPAGPAPERGAPAHLPSPNAIKTPGAVVPPLLVTGVKSAAFLAHSAAFRREMQRFADDALPSLAELRIDPLPGRVPEEADELGEPLASFRLPGESRIGTSIAGSLMILFGLPYLVMPVAALVHPPLHHEDIGPAIGSALAGLTFASLGVWLIWERGLTPSPTLWVCPEGLIWEYGPRVGLCRWDAVEDFAASGATGRPLIWITPREGVRFVFSARHGPAINPITEYIELKTSAALLPLLLVRIFAGERVSLGDLSMDRNGIAWRREQVAWSEVAGIAVAGDFTRVEVVRGWSRIGLRSRDVSFPMVAQAIARIITEDGLPT
jgi:hypothetical protein